ncbi:hypothetical protein MBLNU230_g3537t1 [Neophaeotheca triangularis]
METIRLPHLEAYPLTAALFTNVSNPAFLRQQLLAGNTDFEYAFLDATLLLSRAHVLAASFKAINAMLDDKLSSRNVHSEIVFNLSPNNNIAESFRRFGVQETTTTLLAIKVHNARTTSTNPPTSPPTSTPETTTQQHLQSQIQGELQPLTDANLARHTDLSRVRKVYKLDAVPKGDGELRAWRRESERAVLGAVALKGS